MKYRNLNLTVDFKINIKISLLIILITSTFYCQSQTTYSADIRIKEICKQTQLRAFSDEQEALSVLDEILEQVSLDQNFTLVPCQGIENAKAIQLQNTRYILYDLDFMKELDDGSNITSFSIFAHEVGHHLSNHNLRQTNIGSIRKDELKADEFSGYIMGRMGFNLKDAKLAMNSVRHPECGQEYSHPCLEKRLIAIETGWNNAHKKYKRKKIKKPVIQTKVNKSWNEVYSLERTVSGKVTDEDGETVPGVNVVIKGTTTGTTTDLDGNYKLSVSQEHHALLVYSSVGFKTQEVSIYNRSILDVLMLTDVQLSTGSQFDLVSGFNNSPLGLSVSLDINSIINRRIPISDVFASYRGWGSENSIYSTGINSNFYYWRIVDSRFFGLSSSSPSLVFDKWKIKSDESNYMYKNAQLLTGLNLRLWRIYVDNIGIGQTVYELITQNQTLESKRKFSFSYKAGISIWKFYPYFYYNITHTNLMKIGSSFQQKRLIFDFHYESFGDYSSLVASAGYKFYF